MTLIDDLRDPRFIGQEGMRSKAADEIERLQENLNLLYAAIAEDGLTRLALQTIARNIREPAHPSPEVIAWARRVLRERVNSTHEQDVNK